MIKTPINDGILQSDLDTNGFDILGLDGVGSGLPAGGTIGQLLQKQSSTDGDADWATVAGGTGTNPLITVNVKDAPYNAVGDGVADDTAAIQAAMNYVIASTNGGVVFFPNGVYLCNGAFDATTNSILKIPYADYSSPSPYKTVSLQGQAVATSYGAFYGTGAVIKTTKVGTGYYPALLAANPSQGYPADDLTGNYFNTNVVHIKNLSFMAPDNPSLSAVRMDTASVAIIENVTILAAGNSEPTHDVVGLWMPSGGNSGRSYARNVFIQCFRTGLMVSEHFVGHNVVLVTCSIALGLTTGYQPAECNFQTYWCPTHIGNFGNHSTVKFIARLEDGDPRVGGATPWQYVINHISDSGNTLYGKIDYIRVREPERFHGNDLILSGAANVDLYNLYTSSHHWTKIGTDARLVSITGGVKLEVRNAGTGVWVEATRYTNP